MPSPPSRRPVDDASESSEECIDSIFQRLNVPDSELDSTTSHISFDDYQSDDSSTWGSSANEDDGMDDLSPSKEEVDGEFVILDNVTSSTARSTDDDSIDDNDGRREGGGQKKKKNHKRKRVLNSEWKVLRRRIKKIHKLLKRLSLMKETGGQEGISNDDYTNYYHNLLQKRAGYAATLIQIKPWIYCYEDDNNVGRKQEEMKVEVNGENNNNDQSESNYGPHMVFQIMDDWTGVQPATMTK